MYITPDSTVFLLEGVPLDNSYTDTIFFDNVTNQHAHFTTAYDRYEFNKLSYQRVNKGTIRVEKKADDLYACNYMVFQNTAYGSKWFYAFINAVTYINDITTEIAYEIDVMQTWFFEAILEPSYVDREHSSSDVIGEHLLPEPVDLGLIICQQTQTTDYFDSYVAVIALAEDDSTRSSWGNPINMSNDDNIASVMSMGYKVGEE